MLDWRDGDGDGRRRSGWDQRSVALATGALAFWYMTYWLGWTTRGIGYLLRGLRSGRMSLAMVGFGMILVRLARARRRTKVADFLLEAGDSAVLRVTEPGADPVTFRVEAARRR